MQDSNFLSNDDSKNGERTDVLGCDKNVSRETFGQNPQLGCAEERPPNDSCSFKESRQFRDKKRLGKLRECKNGGASVVRKDGEMPFDSEPCGFNNPTMKELYDQFRSNGLSGFESWYNAAYLRCSDNYYSSGVGVKKKYENVYSHPLAWFGNATTMWRHNKWSIAMKLLEIPAVIGKGIHGAKNVVSRLFSGFSKGAESSGTVSRHVAGLFSMICLVGSVAIASYWWNLSAEDSVKIPALQLYVDGEHVGNVASIKQVNDAKNAVEDTISSGLGTSYSLGCNIEYTAVRSDEAQMLNEAKLHKILHETAHEDMLYGYCLYKGDLPICAMEDKVALEESIRESISYRYPDLVMDDEVQNIGYKDFVIRQGSYPKTMFVSESQLRFLLSLPQKANKTDDKTKDERFGESSILEISDGTLLNTGEHSIGSSSDVASTNLTSTAETVSVPIEAVITRTETKTEIVPFSTEYVYDDNLPEGLTIPVSAGRNGIRTATYSVDYIDGKEMARRMIDDRVEAVPVNAVKKMGTRPLTDEEKAYKSTGTYIYPSPGQVSSTYGWRLLGGQNEFHKGLDIRSDMGLDLVASDGGTVIQAEDRYNGYGLCVLIQHDDGTITRYAHCDELYVAESQKVKQGQLIGKMGSTGFATGVHVHFEILKDGMTVDPLDYLIPR